MAPAALALLASVAGHPSWAGAPDDRLAMNDSSVSRIPAVHFEVTCAITPAAELTGVSGSSSRTGCWLSNGLYRLTEDSGHHRTTAIQTPAGARMVSHTAAAGKRTPQANATIAEGVMDCMVSDPLHDLLLHHGDGSRSLLKFLTDRGIEAKVSPDGDAAVWVGYTDDRHKADYRVRLTAATNWLADRLEATRPIGSGETSGHAVEVTQFRELSPGVWFPSRAETRVLLNGKVASTHLRTVAVKSVGVEPGAELRTLPLPPGIWVRDVKRKTFVKTDAAGNLTAQEQIDASPDTHLVEPPAAAGPTPPDAEERWAARRTWATVAAVAVACGLGLAAVRLYRRG
jgi:hypothetical protein